MKSISSSYLKMIYNGCVTHSGDKDIVLSVMPEGKAGFDNPSTRFDRRLAPTLINTAVHGAGDPTIGLKIGVDFRPETLLDLGYAFPFCQNMRDVIALNAYYQPLIQTIGTTKLAMRDDSAWLDWYPNYSDTEYHRYFVEMIFAGYATIGRWLLWGDDTPVLSMHFRHDAPDDLTTHKMVFGDNTIFNSDFDGVEFIADVVDVPMPNRNPEMLAFLKTRLADQLHRLNSPISDSEEALSCILAALPEGRPSITKIAKLMGMSERTLRRRLDEDGETFRSILERARRESAETYMRANDLTHAEIALRLGFNDQSAFSRAFKSWFNQTPSEYQAALSIGA
jgi:AraC-like DNA-binding protein